MTSIFMVIGIVGWIALLTSIYVYKKAKGERLKSITIDDKESTDPNVVVIGGGTGQSVFLRGLKKRTRNITAIVTVADDGGSTGRLRKQFHIPAMGDIRNVMNALSANQYDAAIVDLGVAKNYVKSDEFKMLDESLMDEQNYVIAKKENKDVIKKINKCIKKFLASDDYDKLCKKYDLSPLETK